MLSGNLANPVPKHPVISWPQEQRPDKVTLLQLTPLAIEGLTSMFDANGQLFSFTTKLCDGQFVNEGKSLRYSIMSLLGLNRLKSAGILSPINVQAVVTSWIKRKVPVDDLGDKGLLLWLCAQAAPDLLEEVYRVLNLPEALSKSKGAREKPTTELSWVLSGLSHAHSVPATKLPGLRDLAYNVYKFLQANQGASGIFGHMARTSSVAGALRGGIGSFADQVYPIYAYCIFGQAFEVPAALTSAQQCADTICRNQGPFGEWWWHYHARNGRVVQRYPVYSVHQHAMGPLALFALSEATGVDFSEPIYKGLQWIAGQNHLGVDLQSDSGRLVWRGLYQDSAHRTYVTEALNYLGVRSENHTDNLKILYECRPYELGWLLYASAGERLAGATPGAPSGRQLQFPGTIER
jgi:hypothetical protein